MYEFTNISKNLLKHEGNCQTRALFIANFQIKSILYIKTTLIEFQILSELRMIQVLDVNVLPNKKLKLLKIYTKKQSEIITVKISKLKPILQSSCYHTLETFLKNGL